MLKRITILLSIFFFFNSFAYCQSRMITGKIIDKNFLPIYGAIIFTSDTTLLGITDSLGNFSINLPISNNFLRIAAVGLEWKLIHLEKECNQIEAILLNNATYDFRTLQKVDRLRKKEFKKLPKLHANAFTKGIFSTSKPCYDDIFLSDVERQNPL